MYRPRTIICFALCGLSGCHDLAIQEKEQWQPQYTIVESRIQAGTEPEVASQCHPYVTQYHYVRNEAGLIERAEGTVPGTG